MSRVHIALLVTMLLLSSQPALGAWAEGTHGTDGEGARGTAPWWATWGGDLDRDGVHDLLEVRAAEALATDPSSRLDLVVDLSRPVRDSDVGRLRALGLEVQLVSEHVDAVLGSAPAAAIPAIRELPDVVMLEAQGVGVPVLASAGPSVSLDVAHGDLGFTGRGVTVAVLDTGVRATHASLDDMDDDPFTNDPKLAVFYDAYSNTTTTAYDQGSHGTWTAGIAVGTGAGSGNVGGAPGAMLVGVRVGAEGGFPESTTMRGMEWVIDHRSEYNISVMSCSWGILLGGPNDHNGNSAISRLADSAVAAGINVVVAGGNTALSATVTSPGDARDVITVGSVNDNHILSTFSSEGPTADGRIKPDVCAPGESVTGPSSGSDTGWYTGDGTSASAPLVGGLIACMLEANPSLTPAEVKQVLHETSEHNTALATKYLFTPNNGYGWGVVDAIGAIERARDLLRPRITVPSDIAAGVDVEVTVEGSYTRTQFTERGKDGRNPLTGDTLVLDVEVPSSWGRPQGASYTMEGPMRATVVPDPISQDGDLWRLSATFNLRQDVTSATTGTPTITFTTGPPLSSDGETYVLNATETLNDMVGDTRGLRLSVGGNVPPMVTMVAPGPGETVVDASFVVRWTDDDPDSDASISLYSDTDTDPSSGLVLIDSGIREDPDGQGDTYVWDTSTLSQGSSYYVRAVISDGANPSVATYSPGYVTVMHGSNAAPTVEVIEPDGQGDTADRTYSVQWLASDPDDVARLDLYWDTDGSGYDGTAIATGLTEEDGPGAYAWDTSGLPDGARIWVYAVVSDGTNAPARAYSRGPVTIAHQGGPTVEQVSPTGLDVALDEPVRVTFDSDMDHASAEEAFSVSPHVAGAFTWVGYTMRFDPDTSWAPQTTYRATVSRTAKDAEGRAMGYDRSWEYTTAATAPPPVAPRVSVISPREGAELAGDVWVEGMSEDLGAGGVVEVRVDATHWREASGNDRWTYLWDTTEEFDGAHTIFVRGTTAKGAMSAVLTINVTTRNQPNRAPVVQSLADAKVRAGEPLELQVLAYDPDDDPITFTDDTPLFEVDASTGTVLFRPAYNQAGSYKVTFSVSDGRASTRVTLNLTVMPEGAGTALAWPSWLGPTQTALLLAVVVLVGFAVALRRAGRRARRRPAHKVKVPAKDNVTGGDAA
jgi:hypothetical protein